MTVPIEAIEAIGRMFGETVHEAADRVVNDYDESMASRGERDLYRMASFILDNTRRPPSQFEAALKSLQWNDHYNEGAFMYAGMDVHVIFSGGEWNLHT